MRGSGAASGIMLIIGADVVVVVDAAVVPPVVVAGTLRGMDGKRCGSGLLLHANPYCMELLIIACWTLFRKVGREAYQSIGSTRHSNTDSIDDTNERKRARGEEEGEVSVEEGEMDAPTPPPLLLLVVILLTAAICAARVLGLKRCVIDAAGSRSTPNK